MAGPRIAVTDRIKEVSNEYLGFELFPEDPAMPEGVKKSPITGALYSQKKGDGEVGFGRFNLPSYTDKVNDKDKEIHTDQWWRWFDSSGRVITSWQTRWAETSDTTDLFIPVHQGWWERARYNDFNVVPADKLKLLIAAMFDVYEVSPEFIAENYQAIDERRAELFPGWQSGVSSIDEYFVKE